MSTLERVHTALQGIAFQVRPSPLVRDNMLTLDVALGDAKEILRRLRDACGFDTSILVTAVDHHPREPRFEMCWQFLSVEHNDRVRIHALVPSAEPSAPTIVDLWPGGAYGERECFDMFGVVFEGHPNLKRLLMPDEYDHFPLRKDFPHQGIEPDRLYRESAS